MTQGAPRAAGMRDAGTREDAKAEVSAKLPEMQKSKENLPARTSDEIKKGYGGQIEETRILMARLMERTMQMQEGLRGVKRLPAPVPVLVDVM